MHPEKFLRIGPGLVHSIWTELNWTPVQFKRHLCLLFDYRGLAKLWCARSTIMHKIMRAHNRILPRSLGIGLGKCVSCPVRSIGGVPAGGWTIVVCDTCPVRRQTYGYLPSRRASPTLDRHQIILLGDRVTCVWTTCPSARPGVEPATFGVAGPTPWPLYATRPQKGWPQRHRRI